MLKLRMADYIACQTLLLQRTTILEVKWRTQPTERLDTTGLSSQSFSKTSIDFTIKRGRTIINFILRGAKTTEEVGIQELEGTSVKMTLNTIANAIKSTCKKIKTGLKSHIKDLITSLLTKKESIENTVYN